MNTEIASYPVHTVVQVIQYIPLYKLSSTYSCTSYTVHKVCHLQTRYCYLMIAICMELCRSTCIEVSLFIYGSDQLLYVGH